MNELVPTDEQNKQQKQTQAIGEVDQAHHDECLKSKHAIEIKKIISTSTDLRQLRYRIKTVSKEEQTTYKGLFYNGSTTEENVCNQRNRTC